MEAVAVLDKSTTVRSNRPLVPIWLRRSFQLTAFLMPGAAVAWAHRIFFTPPRARVRPEEEAMLARGRSFEIQLDGGSVAGWSWGMGAPVLLVHGWGGHTGQMTPLAAALVASGHRVIGADMPGHGRSTGSTSSLVHYRHAIEAVTALFGPFQGVAAHSFGCAGVTYALSRTPFAARAVFLAPPVGFQGFWDRFCHDLGVPPPVWQRVVSTSEEHLAVRFADLVPAAIAPRLEVPLRIIHDQGDVEVPHSDGAELARLWPGAEFISTSGLGHYRLLRDEATVGRVVDFLASGRS